MSHNFNVKLWQNWSHCAGPWKVRDSLSSNIVNLDGITLASSTTVRNLGVILDQELSFNSHAKQFQRLPGSQVSIIDERWKEEYLPTIKLRHVSETLDSSKDLKLTAANGTKMPYLGMIETTFRLASETDQAKELIIPVLVVEGSHQSNTHTYHCLALCTRK